MTPFSLYKWLVVPMDCRNALATHKCHMCAALRPYIGKICHIYLDDIIIWSNSTAEHVWSVETILRALCKHKMFCSPKKTELFCTTVQFLGHVISANGIQPDPTMVKVIADWPVPHNTTDIHSFLGLVRYIAAFLPRLAEHTSVLTPLTMKNAGKNFPHFEAEH